jgi:bifunctional UDP-N-acetylglucosamine pyrophosphorylase / glucosamine-1-phosphate N-acetyltransferase
MRNAIILAAGKGTRMVSSKNKVMHEILGKPMIEHVIDSLDQCNIDFKVVVIGHEANQFETYFKDKVTFAYQHEQLGTAHAVMQAADVAKNRKGSTIIIYGDIPLVQPETIELLFNHSESHDLTVATAVLDDPKQYGRIVRDEQGRFKRIVEYKDASDFEKSIREINTGIYCVDNELLFKHLFDITNNNVQNEFYITDIVEIFNKNKYNVGTVIIDDVSEVMGINDRVQLFEASKWLQNKINTSWMIQGVTLINPEQTYIDPDVQIGKDSIIYPNVYLQKSTKIGEGCIIYPGTMIINGEIGDYTTVDSSRISDSKVGAYSKIGPFTHLRNGTVIHDKSRIGNFVEVKNSEIGENGRCAHLTYVGDATVGKDVNFGCGVVTVNYDGKHKYRTIIEEGAFIGSNVNLIAPITIGRNSVIAAGTTVNKDVPEGDMAIGRSRQENKPGYGQKYKNR